MKTVIILLLLGAIAAAVAWKYCQSAHDAALAQGTGNAENGTRENSAGANKSVSGNSGAGVSNEKMAQICETVQAKARLAGEWIEDARIIAVIKGKFFIEKDLSALAISVDCHDGDVKLTGSVTSPDQLERAAALARQTSGVHDVTSQVVVRE